MPRVPSLAHDPETIERMLALRGRGYSHREIAAAVGLPRVTVAATVSALAGEDGPDDEHLSPTPAEIRRGCAAIQAGWTPRERAKRCVLPPASWSLPVTRFHAPEGRA